MSWAQTTPSRSRCVAPQFRSPEHAAVALHPLVHGMAMTVNCYPERKRIHALVFVYQSADQSHVLGSAWILFAIPGCQASGGQCVCLLNTHTLSVVE